MRIGIITGEYPPMKGGVGAYTQRLAQALTAQGHSVGILTDTRGNAPTQGITVAPTVTGWGYKSLNIARAWAKNGQFEVVSLQYQTAAYQMSAWIHTLPRALRDIAPLVTTFHDLRVPYLFPKAGALRRWVVNHLAETSHGVIATNHEDYAHLQVHRHAALIPIGSNVFGASHPSADIRQQLPVPTDAPVYAFFGFVNRSKGIETLLHSLATLHARGVAAQLVMIGDLTGTSDPTNAAYAQEIRQLIATLQLEDAVHWTGFVDDATVSAYLQSADAVVLPFADGASYRRGTLMAALGAACAIVTTQPSVPISTFAHAQNMLLTPIGDVPALTDALITLYNNPSLRQHLKAGASTLAQQFDWRVIGSDYANFYATILRGTA